MHYDSFLNTHVDADLRDRLWGLFTDAEQEAKKFPISAEDWVDIYEVEASTRCIWHEKGLIEIEVKRDDLGSIFHETFHSAFHNSPLWQDEMKRDWGDGFCEAFRFFMEEKHLGDSRWLNDVKTYLPKECEEILDNRSNVGWKLGYCIPCTRIVNKVEGAYDKLLEVWEELNNDPGVSLEDYFDYPKTELSERFR